MQLYILEDIILNFFSKFLLYLCGFSSLLIILWGFLWSLETSCLGTQDIKLNMEFIQLILVNKLWVEVMRVMLGFKHLTAFQIL